MKSLLLILVLGSASVRGGEAGVSSMRLKLQARIREMTSPAAPASPTRNAEGQVSAETPVLMKPVVVSESPIVQAVATALEREEENRREERFSAFDGGTIYRIGRIQIGGWWSADEGWTFLRFNKVPTRRQADASAATLRELEELANIGRRHRADAH